MVKELELIRRIRAASLTGGRVTTGIGDDAAIVDAPGGVFVLTTDLIVEGTHFRKDDPARAVGRKALAVSLSDVAAMGCRATAAFLAVALRRDLPADYAEELLAGVRAIAAEFDVPLAGGDTTETSGPVVLCSTVTGEPFPGRAPVRRAGARPGEVVLVTGELGGSLAGRHLGFVPRLREAEALVGKFAPGAMIDLSDGLSTDARHVAEESGVTIVVAADRVPVAPAAGRAGDPAALAAALNDGEDFELLFTLPADQADAACAEGLAGTRVTRIGEVVAGGATVRIRRPDGREEELRAGGYEHFHED